MKTLNRVLFVLLAAAGLLILCWPVKQKLKINGEWKLNSITQNGIKEPADGQVVLNDISYSQDKSTMYTNGISISNNYSLKQFNRDSVLISLRKMDLKGEETEDISGSYKANLHSKVIGGGKQAYYRYTLNLISKDKNITMSRENPVEWENYINLHGRP